VDRVGARFDGVCSGSSARPEQFGGGMCVRVEKWREDAQPEWPQAASATRDVPVVGGEAQAFPETGAAGATGGSEILEGGRHGRHGGRVSHAGPASHAGRIRTEPSGPPGSSWPVAPKGVRRGPAGPLSGPPAGPSGALADPWGASAGNDPDEVTVQLDGPAEELGDPEAKSAGHDGSDGPVFVDESGRRSRRYRRIGMAIGIACAVYAVVIVVTLLSGSSDAPWLPVPGQRDDPPAGKVNTSPLPAESGRPSGGSGSVAPGNIPTASDGTTPSPGASASATGASKSPAKATTSASAKPSASKSASTPAGGTVSNPVVQPSHPQDTPSSGPSTPTGTTSAPAEPTPSPTVSAGTGTVADAPNSPSPVAQGPAAPSEPAPAPSKTPEHIV